MPHQFLLESHYSLPGAERHPSARAEALGRLLNVAFEGPPPDAEMYRLLAALAARDPEPRPLALVA